MNHSPIKSRARGIAVAGIVSSAMTLGVSIAHADPALPAAPTEPAAAECQSYWPSPYQVCGEIRDLYNSLGGPGGSLSFPKAAEVTNPDGSKYSAFINGTIYWTPATGAYVG